MKKQLLLSALVLAFALSASAKPYSVTVLGEYGYNTTWEHFGGGEVRANLPFNDYFEMDLAVEGLSSQSKASLRASIPAVSRDDPSFLCQRANCSWTERSCTKACVVTSSTTT